MNLGICLRAFITSLCSGMIACACGNDNVSAEWSVECECVCIRLEERMVSGLND